MKNSIKYVCLSLAVAMSVACNDDAEVHPVVELEAVTVENLAAPNDVIDRTTGTVTEERPFQYFSFESNGLVGSVEADWDVAFKGTTILVNSGISGPGEAKGAVVQGIFDEMEQIPASINLQSDGENGLAIPTGSGNGWYNYNPATNIVSPIPGRVLVFQTNRGNMVKVEILSYYKNNPPLSSVDPMASPSAHYTFRYVLQPDGSNTF
ncbi:HmuY family protein [Pararhodonellum marinum]|uniref:HmuY family protein n=1 Tax=Pararhodonellum marinum TaxID=2755358 RepID=UPI00188F69FE|nr:HmuY family protein [Pararhodonellum marinum]